MLLNRYVGESTAAKHRLAELEGSSFAIEIVGTDLTVVMAVREGTVVLTRGDPSQADASLHSTPLGLAALLGDGSLARLKESGAELHGKLHVAETFADLVRFALPDPEYELSGWVGDIAAHEIGRAARGLHDWTSRAGRALELDVAEYLQHESGALVSSTEARRFHESVDRIRDDVERAEQRVDRIERALAAEE